MPSREIKQYLICRYRQTCQHKRMEPLAASATEHNAESAANPILVKKNLRIIKVDKGTSITIDLEDLKKELKESQYQNNFFMGAT